MLEELFADRGWAFTRDGDDEIVAQVPGSWSKYELRGLWREDDRVLQLLALPDLRVPPARRTAIYETMGLANEQVWIGHFELWSSSGMLLFRHAALLEGGREGQLAAEQADMLVDAALDECERFYPAFQFVLWADKAPADAIAAALIETHGEA